MEIKVGEIYLQKGGIAGEWPNLVVVIPRYHQSERIINIEMIIAHNDYLIKRSIGNPIGVFAERLSIPTFHDIFKCGTIINPKYKTILKEFLEGLTNV